jgi:hypothetical protein
VNPVPDPLLFFLVVPGIELGPPDLYPRTLTTRPQRRSLGDSIDTIKKNTETLIDASKGGWSRNKHRENQVYVAVLSAECRSKSGHKNRKHIVWKCVTVQIFGDDSNKSKFYSGEN